MPFETDGWPMNIFDFDKTLYRGDSTLDFWRFALGKCPQCWADVPAQFYAAIKYALGRSTKEAFKQSFYRFLKRVEHPAGLIRVFWDRSMGKMNEEVLSFAHEGDLVVSASPRFLLQPPCSRLGLKLIASEVDIASGSLEGPNCYGQAKVDRIREEGFPLEYEMGFSDSLSDAPMLALAHKQYLVGRKGIVPVRFDK